MTHEILDPTFDPQPGSQRADAGLFLPPTSTSCRKDTGAPWALLMFALERTTPSLSEIPSLMKWAVFTLVELTLLRTGAWSPGSQLLEIQFVPVREHAGGIDQLWQGRVPFVSRHVRRRESWEIEFMQSLTPELNVGAAVLAMVLLALAIPRLRRHAP